MQGQKNELSDLEVHYEMKLIQDSTNKELTTKAEMILLVNKNKSYYFNPEMVKFYARLEQQINSSPNLQDLAKNYIPVPKIRQSVWKENQEVTITSPLGKYNYSYKSDEIQWELLPEVKKIEDFICHFAKANIEGVVFYAWYTLEIPFSEGPFKFKGLPGLILELHNKNQTIVISATQIEKKSIEIIRIAEALNITLKSRKEFLSAREKYFNYPFTNNFPKVKVQQKLEQLKKINVFLD